VIRTLSPPRSTEPSTLRHSRAAADRSRTVGVLERPDRGARDHLRRADRRQVSDQLFVIRREVLLRGSPERWQAASTAERVRCEDARAALSPPPRDVLNVDPCGATRTIAIPPRERAADPQAQADRRRLRPKGVHQGAQAPQGRGLDLARGCDSARSDLGKPARDIWIPVGSRTALNGSRHRSRSAPVSSPSSCPSREPPGRPRRADAPAPRCRSARGVPAQETSGGGSSRRARMHPGRRQVAIRLLGLSWSSWPGR